MSEFGRNDANIEIRLTTLLSSLTSFCPYYVLMALSSSDCREICHIVLMALSSSYRRENICHIVKSPAEVSSEIKRLATDVAYKAVSSLEGAGIFAVELFLTSDDRVILRCSLLFHI